MFRSIDVTSLFKHELLKISILHLRMQLHTTYEPKSAVRRIGGLVR